MSVSAGGRWRLSCRRAALGLIARDQFVDLVRGTQFREGAVRVTDRREARVRLDGAQLAVRVDVEAERGRVERPDGAAVRDDERAPAFVCARDAEDGADDATRHLLVRLAVAPAREAFAPAGRAFRETLL